MNWIDWKMCDDTCASITSTKSNKRLLVHLVKITISSEKLATSSNLRAYKRSWAFFTLKMLVDYIC